MSVDSLNIPSLFITHSVARDTTWQVSAAGRVPAHVGLSCPLNLNLIQLLVTEFEVSV